MSHLKAALTALQFLSQIPVFFKSPSTEKEVGLSLCYYPLAGLLFGVLLYAGSWLLSDAPVLVSAALILTGWVWLSGALHLDGLADSADAWLGGRGDPQRTLDIMKDPTAGPVAVVVLLLLLLLKFTLIHSLLSSGQLGPLLLAPVIGRMALPALLLSTPYVRQQGLGRWLLDYAPRRAVWLQLGLIVLGLLLVMPVLAMAIFLSTGLMLWQLRRWMIGRIGGATGDTLGGALEIIEVLVLLVVVLLQLHMPL